MFFEIYLPLIYHPWYNILGLFGIDSVQSKVLEIIREGIVRDLIYENNIQILDKGEVKIMLVTDRQTDRQTDRPEDCL